MVGPALRLCNEATIAASSSFQPHPKIPRPAFIIEPGFWMMCKAESDNQILRGQEVGWVLATAFIARTPTLSSPNENCERNATATATAIDVYPTLE